MLLEQDASTKGGRSDGRRAQTNQMTMHIPAGRTAGAVPAASGATNSVARQPIFDAKLKVFGYELLFRGTATDCSGRFDDDLATSRVLYAGLFSIGLDRLTFGKTAFVNFSRSMLVSDMVRKLPKDRIALEILEHVEADTTVTDACATLRTTGFRIALDDFLPGPRTNALIPFADIVKVDLLNTPEALCEAIPKRFAGGKRVFLAEKVETHEQYRKAIDWGYTLFQGYFFCRPLQVNTREIGANKHVCFRLLKAIQDPSINMEGLERIIRQDVYLSFAIIRYINSAAFGFRARVKSLKHALSLLGLRKIREFGTILLLKRLGNDKPDELVRQSLVRGRFAELLATNAGLAGEAFLAGIFSLIDAILDRPMRPVIDELGLSDDIAAALLNAPGPLTSLLDAVVSYERGDWSRSDDCLKHLPPPGDAVQNLYLNAIAWAEEIMKQSDTHHP